MGDYKVGDYLINKQTKEVVRIIKLYPDTFCVGVKNVKDFVTMDILADADIAFNFSKIDPYDHVAQVLYTSSSNKAVTNETDEE